MARVWFEGLPAYSSLGDSLAGTLCLETDGGMRATDLLLYLHGAETSQITVGSGKNRHVIVQTAPFLELVSSFHDALPFRDADHVGAGTYRFPFRFAIPPDGQPSLATTELPRTRGRFTSQPDGMYVEYELEARVQVPWWVDPVDREVVPVFSPRRVFGSLAPFSSGTDPDRPSLRVQIDQPMVLPGTPVTGRFSVENPRLKDLSRLTLALLRHVEHWARHASALSESPMFSVEIPLGPRAAHYEGPFEIQVPNEAESTGPFTGQLYRTYWVLRAVLDVTLGFDVRVDAVFAPA